MSLMRWRQPTNLLFSFMWNSKNFIDNGRRGPVYVDIWVIFNFCFAAGMA